MPPPLESQYRLLHEGVGLALFPETEVFELSGDDRKTFLNSYNTQDIKSMRDFTAAPGSFLTQKGKIVSDTQILILPDKILLLFSQGYGKKVTEHLATFLMFANVEWRDSTPDWTHGALLGPQAFPLLQERFKLGNTESPATIQTASWKEKTLYFFWSRRWGVEAWEFIGPRDLSLAELDLPSIAFEVLEIARVEAGQPKMGVDMSEEHLVAELGLDITATSFNKGCYLGQETTARVQSRGHVNRKLQTLKLATEKLSIPLPAEIRQNDKIVGHLTSVVHSMKWNGPMGLGIVNLQALENGILFIQGPEGPIPLEKCP